MWKTNLSFSSNLGSTQTQPITAAIIIDRTSHMYIGAVKRFFEPTIVEMGSKLEFFNKKLPPYTLDSISRPKTPVSSVAGGDDTTL
jgi:hypothetical protein